MMRPGEIYSADVDDAGPRPVVVVSRDQLNRGQYVVVVTCTSSQFETRRTRRNCVPFSAGQFGFAVDCVAQCDAILRINVDAVDSRSGPLGVLEKSAFRQVVRAIGVVIGSECEPE